MTGTNRL